MPKNRNVRRSADEDASSPAAAGSTALQDADALDREADRAVQAASAEMDGSHNDERRCIADRAYSLYLARGEEAGDDLSDWLEAERQIRDEQDH